MNKPAITKHKIYNNLIGFSAQDLNTIADFVSFMRDRKNLKNQKIIKLEGILKGHEIDFSELRTFKQQTWKHVEAELSNE